MAVSDWSTTAGSNTSIDGTNIAENCSPGGINNAIRSIMAAVRSFYDTAVTLTGTQALTNKTLTSPAITTPTITTPTMTGTMIEDVYTITDGAAFEIDPANGSVQSITLGANRTPKGTNFQNGQAVALQVNDGTAYTLTWTDATFGGSGVSWLGSSSGGGAAPTLGTTGLTHIVLFKNGGQVYGQLAGYSA